MFMGCDKMDEISFVEKKIKVAEFIEFACDKKNKYKIESHISKR